MGQPVGSDCGPPERFMTSSARMGCDRKMWDNLQKAKTLEYQVAYGDALLVEFLSSGDGFMLDDPHGCASCKQEAAHNRLHTVSALLASLRCGCRLRKMADAAGDLSFQCLGCLPH